MPDENDQFAKYMADFEARQAERLERSMAEVKQQQAALAQYVQAQGQSARQPQINLSDDKVDEKLLKELFENPKRWVAELSEINRNQAAQIASQTVQQYEQRRRAQEDHQAFWQGFASYNGDVADFMPMVQRLFDSQPQTMTASERADAAAAQVRQLIARRRADAVDDDRRQTNQQNLTATASGRVDSAQQRQEAAPVLTAEQRLQEGVDELREWREKRLGLA
jgi:hypothetical protein